LLLCMGRIEVELCQGGHPSGEVYGEPTLRWTGFMPSTGRGRGGPLGF
jgi:hypothetical protein